MSSNPIKVLALLVSDYTFASHNTLIKSSIPGLTTAYLLSKDSSYSITVVAKHMPGDYDIEYASPWAGANYMPYVQLTSFNNP